MRYTAKSFSVVASPTDAYRENWERIFGKQELPATVIEVTPQQLFGERYPDRGPMPAGTVRAIAVEVEEKK